MYRRTLAIAALSLGLPLLVVAAPLRASAPADQVVFATSGDALYSVPATGGQPAPLAGLAGTDPTAQPGGPLFAFIGGGSLGPDVFVAGGDGAGVRNVSNLRATCKSIAWSKDGRSLTFLVVTSKDCHDVCVAEISGDRAKNLTESADDEGAPQWGPAARWLAFTVTPRGEKQSRLAVWDAHGGVRTLWQDSDVSAFSASPRDDVVALIAGPEKSRRLYLINAATGKASPVDLGGREPSEVSFSPDGTCLAIVADGVYLAEADGARVRRIAREGSSPAWSPDGKRLVYTVMEVLRRDDPDDSTKRMLSTRQWIWGIEAIGANSRRLWNASGDISVLGWTEDSRRVIFTVEEPRFSLSVPRDVETITDETVVGLRFVFSTDPVPLISVDFDRGQGTELAAMRGLSRGCVIGGPPSALAAPAPATEGKQPGAVEQ